MTTTNDDIWSDEEGGVLSSPLLNWGIWIMSWYESHPDSYQFGDEDVKWVIDYLIQTPRQKCLYKKIKEKIPVEPVKCQMSLYPIKVAIEMIQVIINSNDPMPMTIQFCDHPALEKAVRECLEYLTQLNNNNKKRRLFDESKQKQQTKQIFFFVLSLTSRVRVNIVDIRLVITPQRDNKPKTRTHTHTTIHLFVFFFVVVVCISHTLSVENTFLCLFFIFYYSSHRYYYYFFFKKKNEFI